MKRIRLIANCLWAISLILLLLVTLNMNEGTPLFYPLDKAVYFFPSYTDSLYVVLSRLCVLTKIAFSLLFLSVVLKVIGKTARKKNYFFIVCKIIFVAITIILILMGLLTLFIFGLYLDNTPA